MRSQMSEATYSCLSVDSLCPSLLPSRSMTRRCGYNSITPPALLLGLLLLLLTTAGCGYRFGETRSEWAKPGTRLFIAVFVNDTHEFAAETAFTQQARQAFSGRGSFDLVTKDRAEYQLQGRIVSVSQNIAVSLSEQGQRVGIAEVEVAIDLKLADAAGAVLWSYSMRDSIDYPGSASLLRMDAGRETALQQLAGRMMQRAYHELAESF